MVDEVDCFSYLNSCQKMGVLVFQLEKKELVFLFEILLFEIFKKKKNIYSQIIYCLHQMRDIFVINAQVA